MKVYIYDYTCVGDKTIEIYNNGISKGYYCIDIGSDVVELVNELNRLAGIEGRYIDLLKVLPVVK